MTQSELIREIEQLHVRCRSDDPQALAEFEQRFGEPVERIARRAVRSGTGPAPLMRIGDKEQPPAPAWLVLRLERRIIMAVLSPSVAAGETVCGTGLSTDTADR